MWKKLGMRIGPADLRWSVARRKNEAAFAPNQNALSRIRLDFAHTERHGSSRLDDRYGWRGPGLLGTPGPPRLLTTPIFLKSTWSGSGAARFASDSWGKFAMKIGRIGYARAAGGAANPASRPV